MPTSVGDVTTGRERAGGLGEALAQRTVDSLPPVSMVLANAHNFILHCALADVVYGGSVEPWSSQPATPVPSAPIPSASKCLHHLSTLIR